jgi:hypothetical protein
LKECSERSISKNSFKKSYGQFGLSKKSGNVEEEEEEENDLEYE